MLWSYLQSNYQPNEPIIMSEINITGMSYTNIRRSFTRLTDLGKVKRYDTGIYYIPTQSVLKSGSSLSRDKVIEKKYLVSDNTRIGYFSGCTFANKLGLTTQVPMVQEIVSNRATTESREIELTGAKFILRKPKITITNKNYIVLQFLDLIKDIDTLSEVEGNELTKKLLYYVTLTGITIDSISDLLKLYPDKLYRNLYETGVLNGLLAL